MNLREHWGLRADLDYLNHGSFGACPLEVLEFQHELRREMESQPTEFLARRTFDLLDAARLRLAEFISADPQGLVPVANATSGVNAVLRSLDLAPGDQLLTTDHVYNACRNALDFVSERQGAKVIRVPVPFPLDDDQQVVDAVLGAVGPRTRLALIDHVTSPTGLVLPVERLVPLLAERGVEVLIDGAHAPGMVALRVGSYGETFYVGNCHKWICAPKSAGFLWVGEDRREQTRPMVISHGANTPRPGRSRFQDEFDWVGTIDPTAFLSVPVAIDLMASLVPGGWPEVMRRNRQLALQARRLIGDALGVAAPCPDAMVGSMAALPLPDGDPDRAASLLVRDAMQEQLEQQHRIEVPVMTWPAPPGRVLRLSAQLYNSIEQYERLAELLR